MKKEKEERERVIYRLLGAFPNPKFPNLLNAAAATDGQRRGPG
jgi:hypothetical protein